MFFSADVEVSWEIFDDADLNGYQLGKKIVLRDGIGYASEINSLTPAHELGHFIGLEHQYNETKSLMSYSSNKTINITEIQMKNLFKAYKN